MAMQSLRTTNADVEWLENGLPFSRQFQDVYFSKDDELGESQHVFLAGNDLGSRWRLLAAGACFIIGELGFGSGLNFLQAWQLWRQIHPQPRILPAATTPPTVPRLHYVAFERFPLRHADLQRIFALWPSLASYSDRLLTHYQDHSSGLHRLWLDSDICLDLYFGDAQSALQELAASHSMQVDAWFADGFSPARNPELWQAELFSLLAQCSKAGSTLSTYSVAGAVRQALQAAGFKIAKQPGFGRKRHMLVAQLDSDSRLEPHTVPQANPWFILPPAPAATDKVIVIGAGIAGCSTAWSLARRGVRVHLIDAADSAFAGASGNEQLALRCRLQAEISPVSEFYLQGYLFAQRQYSYLLNTQPDTDSTVWHQSGLVQLANAQNTRNQHKFSQYKENLLALYAAQIIADMDADELTAVSGLGLATDSALYFPYGGWLNGDVLAKAYLQVAGITLTLDTAIASLRHLANEADSAQWQVLAADGQVIDTARHVVIANSDGVNQLSQCAGLPVQTLRGQTTRLAATVKSRQLRTVISGERTVFPVLKSAGAKAYHTLAASYSASTDRHIDAQDSGTNLQLAQDCFSDKEALDAQVLADRVSFRSATPDRLPLLGALPDLPAMARQYAGLQRDASSAFAAAGIYHRGLYINAAHGSNGLSSAPLGGEILASMICGEPLPVRQAIIDELNPVRFLIRDLKRQKPVSQLRDSD